LLSFNKGLEKNERNLENHQKVMILLEQVIKNKLFMGGRYRVVLFIAEILLSMNSKEMKKNFVFINNSNNYFLISKLF